MLPDAPPYFSHSEIGSGLRGKWDGNRRMSEGEMTQDMSRRQQKSRNVKQKNLIPSALEFLFIANAVRHSQTPEMWEEGSFAGSRGEGRRNNV